MLHAGVIYRHIVHGNVPAFSADIEVQERLKQYGWACVLDVASVGKTTLALRVATSLSNAVIRSTT